jgi:hypothetical protein
MDIKREDLLAAAAAGVLHYGDIDPLLIFLAQRETTNRKARLISFRGRLKLIYAAGILLIGAMTLLALRFSAATISPLGLAALLWFTLMYALCAVVATAWFDVRSGGLPTGFFALVAIALTPVVVFSLHYGIGILMPGLLH